MLHYRLAADGHRTRWSQTFFDAFAEYEPVRQRVARFDRAHSTG
jgi:hypothetical protein